LHLLIVAAGSGSRMGADRNKLLLPLCGRPVIAWTFDAVIRANLISWVGIVGQPVDEISIMSLVDNASKPFVWIKGGSTRQESVQNGLEALPSSAKKVLIHDGARCMADSELFDTCATVVERGDAVIAATPVTDTIKKVDKTGMIVSTPDRSGLWAAQTPQGFSVDQLREGHKEADLRGWNVTDDASLYERLGWPVKVLEAGPSNIKVTTPFDLIVAEALITIKAKA